MGSHAVRIHLVSEAEYVISNVKNRTVIVTAGATGTESTSAGGSCCSCGRVVGWVYDHIDVVAKPFGQVEGNDIELRLVDHMPVEAAAPCILLEDRVLRIDREVEELCVLGEGSERICVVEGRLRR